MSTAKVDLGRHLFYDNRLSGNQTFSCATCHLQSRAFTDGRAQAVGSTGQVHPRSSMGLTNTAYNTVYAWADPNITSLEAQAPHPMFGVVPVELGLAGLETELLTRLRAVPYYQAAFPAAFPDESDPVTLLTIVKAIAAFERTLISGRADYDRATFDSVPTPLSAPAQRGKDLFFSGRTHCSVCHAGFNFTEDTVFAGQTEAPHRAYQNIGLYNIGGNGSYVAGNSGVYESTHDLADTGKFKAPSLRNLSYTAPYMHDGSVATLEDVIEIYAAGGRVIPSGPNAGDGTRNQYKDVLIQPLDLTTQEKADLLAFLRSLDDPTFVTDPRFANPW